MHSFLKPAVSILGLAGAVFGGFVVLIMVAFSGAGNFYQALVPVCAVTFLWTLLAQTWGWLFLLFYSDFLTKIH